MYEVQGKFTHKPELLRENLEDVTTDDSRTYKTPIGNLPSVTTVLGFRKKEFFKEWRRKNPKEAKRTVNRGQKIHSLVESYLNNEVIDVRKIPFEYRKLFKGITTELNKIDQIRGLEFPLYSNVLRMAGRADCIAEYNGKLSVIDFKFLNKMKEAYEIKNYFLQTTAYVIAIEERYNIKINNIVIIAASEDGLYKSFEENPMDFVVPLKKEIDYYYKKIEENHESGSETEIRTSI